MQPLFLKSFKPSSCIIRRTWLNFENVLAEATGLSIKWSTKRPNHSILFRFSLASLHEILARRTNVIISLIGGKWPFKCQIWKENISWTYSTMITILSNCLYKSYKCQAQFTPGWKSTEWTQRWADLWNDLSFSLCAVLSVCHVVATLDEESLSGSRYWLVCRYWTPEIKFNKSLSLSIIRLVNYSVTTSLIYK